MKTQHTKTMAIIAVTLLWASACFGFGGRVTYPDGRAVVGAEVNINLQEEAKYKLTTDATGRFSLPTMDFLDAFVQIKAPDGKDYATVNLPVKVFQLGDLSVVLQPRK